MKKEQSTITFTANGKSATVTGDELHFLVKAMKKIEPVNNCPRCHKVDFRQWEWLGLTMRKCLSCGRIWSFERVEVSR